VLKNEKVHANHQSIGKFVQIKKLYFRGHKSEKSSKNGI
jgi:hypothetical protein